LPLCAGQFDFELTASRQIGECSLFVLDQVLPLLGDSEAGNIMGGRQGYDLFGVIRWLTIEDLEDQKKNIE
jgi:hypothetical protein